MVDLVTLNDKIAYYRSIRNTWCLPFGAKTDPDSSSSSSDSSLEDSKPGQQPNDQSTPGQPWQSSPDKSPDPVVHLKAINELVDNMPSDRDKRKASKAAK